MADSRRIEELKRRIHSDPASIAFGALAEEYRRAGRCEDAIAVCRAGLQRHPFYVSAHVTLGRAMLELGQFDDARAELEYVLSVAPENLAAIRGLAEIHHRRHALESGDLSATEMANSLLRPSPQPPPSNPIVARVESPPLAVAAPVEVPKHDAVLEGLEAFLQAILRARSAAGVLRLS